MLVCARKLICALVHVLVCAPKLACALLCALVCAPKLACVLICALVRAPKLVWALVFVCKKEKKGYITPPLSQTPPTPSSLTWVPQSRLAFVHHPRVSWPRAFGPLAITIIYHNSFACCWWLQLPAGIESLFNWNSHSILYSKALFRQLQVFLYQHYILLVFKKNCKKKSWHRNAHTTAHTSFGAHTSTNTRTQYEFGSTYEHTYKYWSTYKRSYEFGSTYKRTYDRSYVRFFAPGPYMGVLGQLQPETKPLYNTAGKELTQGFSSDIIVNNFLPAPYKDLMERGYPPCCPLWGTGRYRLSHQTMVFAHTLIRSTNNHIKTITLSSVDKGKPFYSRVVNICFQ